MGVQFDSQVQWFPGHMAKTRRLIRENLAMVDIAVELLDARIPQASRNPEIDKLLSAKPRMILMTKSDAADPAATEAWLRYFQRQHIPAPVSYTHLDVYKRQPSLYRRPVIRRPVNSSTMMISPSLTT